MNILENKADDVELSVLAKIDKLQLLYRQSASAVFISLLNAVLLTVILWSVQNHQLLLVWLGILLCSSIARLIVFSCYRKASPQGVDVLVWEKPYFITLLLSSLIWGVGILFITPDDAPLQQAIIFYILIGMAGGAISVYSANRMMTLSVVSIILLPYTAYFLITGDYIFVVMAVGAIVFFLSAIRSTSILGTAMHQNFLMTHQLKLSKEKAEQVARIDELTGLYNRRAFYESGKLLVNNSKRNKDELAVILMDVDNFKAINDKYGHAAGDVTLKQIGEIMLQRLRKSDVFARIGGEEFAMILPLTSMSKAAQLAEELRQVIQSSPVTYDDESFSVTASFGVTSGINDIDTLVRQADMAMYQSKKAGRNSVVCDE